MARVSALGKYVLTVIVAPTPLSNHAAHRPPLCLPSLPYLCFSSPPMHPPASLHVARHTALFPGPSPSMYSKMQLMLWHTHTHTRTQEDAMNAYTQAEIAANAVTGNLHTKIFSVERKTPL